MAEEKEKATKPEKEPTAEATERDEATTGYAMLGESSPFGFPTFYQFGSTMFGKRPFRAGQIVTVQDKEGHEHKYMFFSGHVVPVSTVSELALAGDVREENQQQVTQQGGVEVDERTVRLLIDSAISEIERTGEIMRRDEEEIQRLKDETRAALRKLAA